MEVSAGYKLFLAVGMLISGSCNTIATKLADEVNAMGKYEVHSFEHPFVQALAMFVGELCCLGAFYVSRWRDASKGTSSPQAQPFSPFVFFVPALFDFTGTSLMYIALNKTYTSVFQMLRGSVVIFTGILATVLLKKRLDKFQWLGMVFVLLGLALVGLASVIDTDSRDKAPNPLLGDVLVISAQLVVALQMVYEEKFVGKYEVPALQAVGLEGAWGCLIAAFMLLIFYWIPGTSAGNHLENAPDAFIQMSNKPAIIAATLGTVCSIAFFNFFGLSVTKTMSATTRMVLDSLRNVIIWAFSLLIKWEHLKKHTWVQVIGFVTLLFGTTVYNRLVPGLRQQSTDKQLAHPTGDSMLAEESGDGTTALLNGQTGYLIDNASQPGINTHKEDYA